MGDPTLKLESHSWPLMQQVFGNFLEPPVPNRQNGGCAQRRAWHGVAMTLLSFLFLLLFLA